MGHNSPKPRGGNSNAASTIDSKVVRELAKILNDTGLTEIEVERGDLRVRVAKTPFGVFEHAETAALHRQAAPAATARSDADANVAAHPGAVASPMVGTVYLASDPNAAPFVRVGQPVSEGDTLLLIEAMKTFNPIPAPASGKVLEIRVEDGQPVEFGETLVVIG